MITEIDYYRGKEDILRSIAPLGRDLRHVRINRQNLAAVCEPIRSRHLAPAEMEPGVHPLRAR